MMAETGGSALVTMVLVGALEKGWLQVSLVEEKLQVSYSKRVQV